MPDAQQLILPLSSEGSAAASPRRLPNALRPMLASAGDAPFDDEHYFFEPWWPGTRAFAFIENGGLRLQVDHLADPLAAFPELGVIQSQVDGTGVVLDGTLLVLDAEGRPDRELLRRRLAEPRVRLGTAAFVASDLLWREGVSQLNEPWERRHRRLSAVLMDGDRCVVTRGLRTEGVTLAEAVASMGIEAVSARRISAAWRPGEAGRDWLKLPVAEMPAAEARPLMVLLQRLPLDD